MYSQLLSALYRHVRANFGICFEQLPLGFKMGLFLFMFHTFVIIGVVCGCLIKRLEGKCLLVLLVTGKLFM